MKAINWRSLINKWNYLKSIAFPIIWPRPIIDILIDIDYEDLHCSIQEIKRKPEEPVARLTQLGWTSVEYNTGQSITARSVQISFIRTYNNEEVELQEECWNVGRMMDKDDKDTLDLVSKILKYENGKYQVLIPWKKERHLTNKYQMVLNQLINTERRLIKQPNLSEKYCEINEQYI